MENLPIFTIEYISSLPVRKINYCGQELNTRYDAEKKRIFLLNKDGSYSGRWGTVDLDAPTVTNEETEDEIDSAIVMPPFIAPQAEANHPHSGGAEEKGDPTSFETYVAEDPADLGNNIESQERQEPELISEPTNSTAAGHPKRIDPQHIKVIAVIALIGLLALLFSLFARPSHQDSSPAATTISTTAATTLPPETQQTIASTSPATRPSEETQPPEPGIVVLVAEKHMLPGHQISEDDLSNMEITSADFQAINAMNGIYLSEEASRLTGLVTTQFVVKGTYIDYSDLAISYAPVNPWGRTGTQQFALPLPVSVTADSLVDFLPGTCADIMITVETKVSETIGPSAITETGEPNGGEQVPTTPSMPTSGIEHNSSTIESMIVDTYVIRGASIIDILDAEQNSLFSRYHAFASVPAAYLEDVIAVELPAAGDIECMIPVYIKIAVTAEQAAMIQSIGQSNMTVSVSNTSAIAETDLQSQTYPQLTSVASLLTKQWQTVTAGGVS